MSRMASAVMAVLAMVLPASGAQEGADDLKKEVQELKSKVQALEKQARNPEPPQGAIPAEAPPAPHAAGILDRLAEEIKISGFVDVGCTINPANPEDQTNTLVGFNWRANSFALNNAQLNFAREATTDAIAGFKIELTTGRDADLIDAEAELGDDRDHFDVQEGYVQILAPLGNGVDVKIGKFATLSGYEVIEAKDNFNTSRSLNFMLSIPFTHTGVRATYKPADPVTVTLGAVNGWDVLDDNNHAKTAEFQLAVAPASWISNAATIYYGSERDGESGPKRLLVDLTATATPVEKLTLGANVDWAEEEEAVDGDGDGEFDDGHWSGWALYAKVDLCGWYVPSVRAERFNDRDGLRTGGEAKVWEATLTHEFRIGDDTVVRVEFRHDKADHHIYLDHTDGETSQNIAALEVIYTF